ncbi:unnamed protein product, partial [Polarella glacialis]
MAQGHLWLKRWELRVALCYLSNGTCFATALEILEIIRTPIILLGVNCSFFCLARTLRLRWEGKMSDADFIDRGTQDAWTTILSVLGPREVGGFAATSQAGGALAADAWKELLRIRRL